MPQPSRGRWLLATGTCRCHLLTSSLLSPPTLPFPYLLSSLCTSSLLSVSPLSSLYLPSSPYLLSPPYLLPLSSPYVFSVSSFLPTCIFLYLHPSPSLLAISPSPSLLKSDPSLLPVHSSSTVQSSHDTSCDYIRDHRLPLMLLPEIH